MTFCAIHPWIPIFVLCCPKDDPNLSRHPFLFKAVN